MGAEEIRALRVAGEHERARLRALELLAAHPGDPELHYETACVHDSLGREAEAVPFYQAALAGELTEAQARGAYLGLGSTYRALGRYPEAERTLLEGRARFPGAREFDVFLAMVQHNLGRSKLAVESLLNVVAESSADEGIVKYRKAIAFYAEDVDRAW